MSDRSTGLAPSRLVAVLGPTNTGKTHLAVERMLGHASGMIGLPLRLLAREIYDRIVKLKGARSVALITGEEKIVPPRADYFVCTVEAMPLNRTVEFLAVDEIQLCADRERGHVFTHRLLHARGRAETMFLGAGTAAPLIRHLLPDAEITTRERFSALTYSGPKKLTRLPRRSAVVAFSAEQVYGIAELIRRQRGGAAVVMGSLSPRTRNAQVELYQSGEVDFLVATDAIGMGLNMDVDHVAFAGLKKFDGRKTRWLTPQEIGQIAGRAGRYRKDGTFGVTGEAPDMDEDLIESVENHVFEPVAAAKWRNAALDFGSLPALMKSLETAPGRPGLELAEMAQDETTLRALAQDEDVARLARSRDRLLKLWDVCQLPDFRKTTVEDHARLCRDVFEGLCGPGERLRDDWISPLFKTLDRTDGDIDALAGRLAHVRTLSYVANRPEWLKNAALWQNETKKLEERLSDTLHERLIARFVDRRTSALMRALNVREDVLAGVSDGGEVTVEGHFVGRLNGLSFDPARGESQLEDKALRAAARRAVAPEVARRLGALAAEPDEALRLQPDGVVLWRGAAVARISGGGPFSPRVTLYGDLGPEPVRQRAARRLEAFVARESARRLAPLKRLEDALGEGGLKGLPRGIAWRLIEAGGLMPRSEVAADLKALSQAERRNLRGLGVRIGAHSVWLPALQKPQARAAALAFADPAHKDWRAPDGAVSPLPEPRPDAKALAGRGLRACGRWAVPVDQLETLDELMRAARAAGGLVGLSDQAREQLGWSPEQADEILKALGFARAGRGEADKGRWRARSTERRDRPRPVDPNSPFAALAALTLAAAPEPPARRPRRPRREPAKAAPDAAAPPEGVASEGETRRKARRRPKRSRPAPVAAPAAAEGADAAVLAPAPDSPKRRRPRRRRKAAAQLAPSAAPSTEG